MVPSRASVAVQTSLETEIAIRSVSLDRPDRDDDRQQLRLQVDRLACTECVRRLQVQQVLEAAHRPRRSRPLSAGAVGVIRHRLGDRLLSRL